MEQIPKAAPWKCCIGSWQICPRYFIQVAERQFNCSTHDFPIVLSEHFVPVLLIFYQNLSYMTISKDVHACCLLLMIVLIYSNMFILKFGSTSEVWRGSCLFHSIHDSIGQARIPVPQKGNSCHNLLRY